MVIIVIGAIQAAKIAKAEYEKDKKRNARIVPVEGSAGLMADRHGTPSAGGADNWFGNPRPQPRSGRGDASTAPAHAGIGAWSRSTPNLELQLTHTSTSSAEDHAHQPHMASDSESDAQKALAVEEAVNEVSKTEGNLGIEAKEEKQQVKRELRKHKPRRPAPAPGSFEAMLQAGKTAGRVDGGEFSSETLEDNGVRIFLSEEQSLSPKKRDEVEGSFAAAMLQGEHALRRKEWGRERALVALERKRNASAQGAEMPVDGNAVGNSEKQERGRTGLNGVRRVGERRVVDGSFTAAMQGQDKVKKKGDRTRDKAQARNSGASVLADRTKPQSVELKGSAGKGDVDGSFESAMRRDSRRRAGALKDEGESAHGSSPAMAMVRTAGSKAKPTQRTAEAKDKGHVRSSSVEVRSSMSAQGTMKKRVSRRQ